MLTNCAFQLVFGKLYIVFSIKVVFLASILLFEIGSAICGAAPNSVAFIVGRSIAGLGAGGIQSGIVRIDTLPRSPFPPTPFPPPPIILFSIGMPSVHLDIAAYEGTTSDCHYRLRRSST